jgi:hypothetical protein
MPALLKCGLVPLVANAVLDGHLPIIFGVVWTSILDLVFGVRPFEYLPVYRCFLDLGVGRDPFSDQFGTLF